MRAEPRGRFQPLTIEAETLLNEGRLAEAITSMRQSHGLSRRDAKRCVELHIESNPILGVQLETQRREARRRFFIVFVVVDVLITAAVIYWFFYRTV
jgi:hypothetical protein